MTGSYKMTQRWKIATGWLQRTILVLFCLAVTGAIVVAQGPLPPPPPPLPPPTEPPPSTPAVPAFSAPFQTLFPGQPFVTCIQGQFEEPQPFPAPPGVPPSLWYIKANGTGALKLDVAAVSVSSEESGSITATLFDGFTIVGSVVVVHPTVAGTSNTGLITANVVAGTVYRLEVVRGPAMIEGTREAHHYKLALADVPADVAINSPSFRYLEGEAQIFHLNLAAGEPINLQITPAILPPPDQTQQLTVEVSRRDTYPALLQPPTTTLSAPGSLAPPMSINIANPFGGLPGTVVVKIYGSSHYTLDKTTPPDRGWYVDTCAPPPPPPPPPGNAEARTIGYWKNHQEQATSRLEVFLGNYNVNTFGKAKGVFDEAHARNAYDMLAAQLLATRLNLRNGVPSACIDAVQEEANHELVHAGYAGPGTTRAPSGTTKSAINALKDALDAFNNNGCL